MPRPCPHPATLPSTLVSSLGHQVLPPGSANTDNMCRRYVPSPALRVPTSARLRSDRSGPLSRGDASRIAPCSTADARRRHDFRRHREGEPLLSERRRLLCRPVYSQREDTAGSPAQGGSATRQRRHLRAGDSAAHFKPGGHCGQGHCRTV